MRPRDWVLVVADIRRWRFWLSLPFAFCLLLAAGCDIPPASAPTEALATPASAPTGVAPTGAPQPVVRPMPSPWDLSWLPGDFQAVATRIDSILDGTGLSGHGATILEHAQEFGVNPFSGRCLSHPALRAVPLHGAPDALRRDHTDRRRLAIVGRLDDRDPAATNPGALSIDRGEPVLAAESHEPAPATPRAGLVPWHGGVGGSHDRPGSACAHGTRACACGGGCSAGRCAS